MLSFPLIARELRVQSRKRSTYRARTGWGLAAVALLFFFTLSFPGESVDGRNILSMIHFCLVAMVLFLAPLGAADSISRERREGTLGLLLLTRLSPAQVVLGKLAAHSIRLFYLLFMMLPFLLIPVLLGGVSLQDFLITAVMLLMLAVAGIAAGLIASAIFLSFSAVLGWALFLTLVITLVISSSSINTGLGLFTNTFPDDDVPLSAKLLFGPGMLIMPVWGTDVAGMFVASRWFLPFVEGAIVLLSLLFLAFSFFFCVRHVAKQSELSGETKRQAAFRKRFLTPVFWRGRYRKIMSRNLDRNPFVWLEYRSAWARSARWSLILLLISAETVLLFVFPDKSEFIGIHFLILTILVIFLTLKSSSSFQREKESGAFELLLVTPLTEKDIVIGRLRAVASYYGLMLFLVVTLGLFGLTWAQSPDYGDYFPLSAAAYFTTMFGSLVSVPVCGLFFALRCRTFLPALLWTAGIAILAPICLWIAFSGLLWYAAARSLGFAMVLQSFLQESWWPVLLALATYHIALSWHCGGRSVRLLRKRELAA